METGSILCETIRHIKIDFDRYLAYMHGQIKELVTGYGKLDLLWFDFSYDDMTGEKWKATELIKMVRKYQPDVIIDNRLEGAGDNHGSITTEEPLIYSGDFARSFLQKEYVMTRENPFHGNFVPL